MMRKDSDILLDLIGRSFGQQQDAALLRECLTLLMAALDREQGTAKPKAEAKPEAEPPAPRGPGAKLKRDTLRRLSDWRAVHGLGSYAILAVKSRGKLTETDIRDIAIGDHPIPLPKWQALSDALDREGQK